jgi:ribose 5-phosphate isomerase RpiB
MKDTPQNSTTVLCWPKRLLSADDLRRHLTSQRELLLLPRTVITPLAADELRAKGIRVSWQVPSTKDATTTQEAWCYAQEKPDAVVASVVKSLERDGITLTKLDAADARTIAATIIAHHRGGIVFTGDPATVCCIANKIAGLRAAAAVNVAQIAVSKKNLGANLFAIEMPGRPFFELRQMLKTIVTSAAGCPTELAKVLKELDGHAHR